MKNFQASGAKGNVTIYVEVIIFQVYPTLFLWQLNLTFMKQVFHLVPFKIENGKCHRKIPFLNPFLVKNVLNFSVFGSLSSKGILRKRVQQSILPPGTSTRGATKNLDLQRRGPQLAAPRARVEVLKDIFKTNII